MNRIKKQFLKSVSMLLIVTILTQTFFANMFVSYADVYSDVATSSNASTNDFYLSDDFNISDFDGTYTDFYEYLKADSDEYGIMPLEIITLTVVAIICSLIMAILGSIGIYTYNKDSIKSLATGFISEWDSMYIDFKTQAVLATFFTAGVFKSAQCIAETGKDFIASLKTYVLEHIQTNADTGTVSENIVSTYVAPISGMAMLEQVGLLNEFESLCNYKIAKANTTMQIDEINKIKALLSDSTIPFIACYKNNSVAEFEFRFANVVDASSVHSFAYVSNPNDTLNIALDTSFSYCKKFILYLNPNGYDYSFNYGERYTGKVLFLPENNTYAIFSNCFVNTNNIILSKFLSDDLNYLYGRPLLNSTINQSKADSYDTTKDVPVFDYDALYNAVNQALLDAGSTALTTEQIVAIMQEYMSKTIDGSVEGEGGNGGSGITSEGAYNQLVYIITSLSNAYGAVISLDIIDGFINIFYKDYVGGTSAEKYDEAYEILNRFVVINGGNSPNDDNKSNKYRVALKFARTFALFLITSGLLTGDASDYVKNGDEFSNVQVGTPEASDSGIIDNIFGKVGQILDFLTLFQKNLLDKLNSFPKLFVDAFGLDKLFANLGLLIKNLSKNVGDAFGLENGFSLSKMFSNVVKSIESLPSSIINSINNFQNKFENMIELLPDILVKGFAFSSLFADLGILLNSLPKSISNLFGLESNFSFSKLFQNIISAIQLLSSDIVKAISDNNKSTDSESSDNSDDSGFKKFLNIILSTLFILIMLVIFFINCLRLIVAIFHIPESTVLLNDNMLLGIQYLKDTRLPLFNMSIHSLLMGCVFFLIFASIIHVLRKHVDHVRVK